MKNITTKEIKPGTPKNVIVAKENTLIGITTLKEFTNKFKPYNNKKAKIIFLTTVINFVSISITYKTIC